MSTNKIVTTAADVEYAQKGSRMTTAGLNALAKAVAGAPLTFSHISLGTATTSSGRIIRPTDETILKMTALKRQRLKINVSTSDVKYNGNGTATVTVQFNNSKIKKGFWIREVGLFAVDPDTKAVILYSYKPYYVLGTYVPGYDGATAEIITINFITVIDQVANIKAVIDKSTVTVTKTQFDNHLSDSNPHPAFLSKGKAVTTSGSFWATGTDNNLHAISAENLQTQILGANIDNLSKLGSRITQTEINIANLVTELGTLQDDGLKANLLLAENFERGEFCDLFKIPVKEQVATDTSICIDHNESIDGLLEGHYYIISDGLHSESVRVTGIGTNEDVLKIFLETPLQHTYNMKKTYLMRSKGLIVESKLGGAGVLQETNYPANYTWAGQSSSKVATLNLNTSLSNKKKFTIDGDGVLSSDGYFTLE